MSRLPDPQAAPPILFGERRTSALLPWSWSAERLSGARTYWVRPRVVFGWQSDMRDPTRWTFTDPAFRVP